MPLMVLAIVRIDADLTVREGTEFAGRFAVRKNVRIFLVKQRRLAGNRWWAEGISEEFPRKSGFCMGTPAQNAANAKNAQKSTGPISKEGRRRSSMNALKHGMTAKIALLPDESPDEFRERLEGMFDSLKPRDPYEVFLVERAVYSSWQLDRVARSESARLCVKACCRHLDEAFRVAVDVEGMVNGCSADRSADLALPVTKPRRRCGEPGWHLSGESW